MNISLLRRALLLHVVLLAACPHQQPAPTPSPLAPAGDLAGIDKWAGQYPQAAGELGVWMRSDSAGSAELFRWDGGHPDRSHELVTWAIANPSQGFDSFAALHPDWQFLHDMMERHRSAADGFVSWCRSEPQAAAALIAHPRGLQWVGHTL